jgi:hypothetical protein
VRRTFEEVTADNINSIAKYTSDYTHLERCTPSIPEPDDPNAPLDEVYNVLESPKKYYATVADSITPAQQARMPNAAATSRENNKLSNSVESLSSSPPRLRKASTQLQAISGPHDPHISGHEPRVFPGAAFQRARRQSTKQSISGSDGTAPDLSSSQQLETSLSKLKETGDAASSAADESD